MKVVNNNSKDIKIDIMIDREYVENISGVKPLSSEEYINAKIFAKALGIYNGKVNKEVKKAYNLYKKKCFKKGQIVKYIGGPINGFENNKYYMVSSVCGDYAYIINENFNNLMVSKVEVDINTLIDKESIFVLFVRYIECQYKKIKFKLFKQKIKFLDFNDKDVMQRYVKR